MKGRLVSADMAPLYLGGLLLVLAAVYRFVLGTRLDYQALSSAVDATGAVVALALGVAVIIRDRFTPAPHIRPAGLAFLAIGILAAIDIAVVDPEPQTLITAVSTFLGGAFYALVLLPPDRRPSQWCSRCWAVAAGLALMAGSVIVILAPDLTGMITPAGLSPVLVVLNGVGSVLLLAAAAKLMWRARSEHREERLVFGSLAGMLGVSGLLFHAGRGQILALTPWYAVTLAAWAVAAAYVIVRHASIMAEMVRARSTAEHLNAVLRNIRQIDALIAGGGERALEAATEVLGRREAYSAVMLAERDPDGTLIRHHVFGSGDSHECLQRLVKLRRDTLCQIEAMEQGGTLVAARARQCSDCPLAEADVGGTVVVTALRHRDRLYGTLTTVFEDAVEISDEELGLIEGVADDLARSMEADRLIREREAALRAAASEEERARQIIETAPALITIVDMQGTISLFNRACEELTGYSREEVIGASLFETLPVDSQREAMRDAFESLLAGDGPVEYENSWRTKHDGERLIVWRNTVRENVDGEPEIVSIGVDVTEQREIEKLYTELVERMGEGVSVVDTEGAYTYVNPALADFLGYSADELIGKRPADFASEQGRQVLETERAKRPTGATDPYEVEWITASGEAAWSVVSPSPRFDRTGEYTGAFSVSTDITNRKLLERRLAEHAEALGRSNEELQEFAQVVSHDLQEPLRKIRAFGDRLAQMLGEDLEERPADYLARMLDAAERMERLINALLAYSRVTSRAQPFENVDLNAAAEDALWDLGIAIEEVGGEVTVGDLPTIEAEPAQMRQLIQNLVQNALKFRRDGVAPRVEIVARIARSGGMEAAESNGQVCELTVSDNGVGFEQKYADRIFGVFERLHRRGEYPGTGMGLAICRKIVDRHRGAIAAHSAPGEGATFTIKIPVHQMEENA